MAEPRDSVVDPAAPKAEQEKRVEDEIEKDDAELFGEGRERAGRQGGKPVRPQ
jgi:hypothetical protein